MTLCTKADFAKLHGVSKPAVGKWEKRGWLVMSEGKVDVEQSNALLTKYRDTTDARATRKAQAEASEPVNQEVNQTVNRPANWPFPQKVIDPDETPAQAAERIVSTIGADMTIEEAKRVKENYLALLNELEYQRESGAVIELALARSVLFEEFRALRDAWLNWPAKYAALIAADLDLDASRVTEVLTGYVHKQITSLGEPEGRFDQG